MKEIYFKHLSNFEKTLQNFGYFKFEYKNIPNEFNDEYVMWSYSNSNIARKISFYFTLSLENNHVSLGVSQCKIPREGTYFDLDDFLKKLHLEHRLQSEFLPGGDFESFINKYFADLENLFNNELRPQIEGKVFEDHGPAMWKDFVEKYK